MDVSDYKNISLLEKKIFKTAVNTNHVLFKVVERILSDYI